MRRNIALLLVVSVLLAVCLCGCNRPKVNYGIPAFDAEEKIIRATWWCPSPTEAEYQLYKDCGLNTVLLVNHNFWLLEDGDTLRDGYYLGHVPGYDEETMTDKSLALAKKMGMSVILADGNYLFGDEYNVYEKNTIDYSAYKDTIVGVFSGDEPSAPHIPKVAENIGNAKKYFPDVPYFCNLFPMYADPTAALKVRDYGEYLDAYREQYLSKTTAPRMVSVDFYPFMDNAGHMPKWLLNYRLLADMADEFDADFHVFIQTADGVNGNYDLQTQEQIRLQVNVALAYGADAYSYYLYQPPTGGYNYGLIDPEGKPSRYYPMAQAVNAEVASLESALQHYDRVDTQPVAPDQTAFSSGCFLFYQQEHREKLYEQSALLTELTVDNRMLVTLLKDDAGNEAFYLVNYFDAGTDEAFEDATATLKLTGMTQAALYGTADRLTGEVTELEDHEITLTLAPGDGCLVIPYR
ncbi:MAG: hypothetical protein IJE00_07885 [Clostridia bacterium]|nr:hypothetical protein [Clostridia bacterium]